MRIYFYNLATPKKAAKRVQRYFNPESVTKSRMKLSRAQEITSHMLGYQSWHELVATTKAGIHSPSLLDEDCPADEQKERLDYQHKILGAHSPVSGDARRTIIQILRVSAGNPDSLHLVEQSRTTNRIVKASDYDSRENEWRFFPSRRSVGTYDDACQVSDSLDRGEIRYAGAIQKFRTMLESQPEDLFVIEEMLSVTRCYERVEDVAHELDQFERVIHQCMPADMPAEGKLFFRWGYIHNRTLLRSILWLAESYYRLGRYSKAKRWFEYSARAYEVMRPKVTEFLSDLERDVPLCNVRL